MRKNRKTFVAKLLSIVLVCATALCACEDNETTDENGGSIISTHLIFNGIPMEGTVEEFADKLKQQCGYTEVQRATEGYEVILLSGKYGGEDAVVTVAEGFSHYENEVGTGKVGSIGVIFRKTTLPEEDIRNYEEKWGVSLQKVSDSQLEQLYSNIKNHITQKYVSPKETTNYYDFWETSTGAITLSDGAGLIQVRFADKINCPDWHNFVMDLH